MFPAVIPANDAHLLLVRHSRESGNPSAAEYFRLVPHPEINNMDSRFRGNDGQKEHGFPLSRE
jgi:hypothetical protein